MLQTLFVRSPPAFIHPASLFNYAGQARAYCPSIKLTAFPSASLPGLAERMIRHY
jgi:hypothetical protein